LFCHLVKYPNKKEEEGVSYHTDVGIVTFVSSLSLKGLPHEMDLAFDDMYGYLGLNRDRVIFPMIL
jgi:hypothetical protein